MPFSPDQLRTLAAVLDAIIPASADGRLPGAGSAGLAPEVAAAIGEQPAMVPMVAAALDAVAAAARTRGAADLAAVPPADRAAIFDAAGEHNPLHLPPLVLLTLTTYYRTPRILEALGHAPRPPFPEGHAVPPTDLRLLDPVRRRPPMYREP